MSLNGAYVLTIKYLILALLILQPAFSAEEPNEEYGPPNLLKTMKTPFGSQERSADQASATSETEELGSISLNNQPARQSAPSVIEKLSLKERLISSRLFLPERMILGQTAKFTVKAKPGMNVAIAMADRDSGAKPIQGHRLRLGPDRRVVAVARVPASGVAEVFIETPIEGDLIGQYLYFEAALWSKEDMSDLEFADAVAASVSAAPHNAVMIGQLTEKKRGVSIVPDGAQPLIMRQGAPSLGSGQP